MYMIENATSEKRYDYESMIFVNMADVKKQLTANGCKCQIDENKDYSKCECGSIVLETTTTKGDWITVRKVKVYGVKSGVYSQHWIDKIINKIYDLTDIRLFANLFDIAEIYSKRNKLI